eukprot:TRINITY_DN10885_c0_g2_i1.p1 TRINITY_DN10885_c0_g2~~TRINITY_DN10885_c0_g2_i1.p1  ORF type:complete len:284 (+),score=27.84 TRINITY_DN10885_c0_g2_i1:303-1154(+)
MCRSASECHGRLDNVSFTYSLGPIALDIVGAGSGWRLIMLHDDVTVGRHLSVGGTATFAGAVNANATGNYIKDIALRPSSWSDFPQRLGGPPFPDAYIVNDNVVYKALMLVGNDYNAAGTRLIRMYDNVLVSNELRAKSIVAPLVQGIRPAVRPVIAAPVLNDWYYLQEYLNITVTVATRYRFYYRTMIYPRGTAGTFPGWILEFTPSRTQAPNVVVRWPNAPRPYEHQAPNLWKTYSYEWYDIVDPGTSTYAVWLTPNAVTSGQWDIANELSVYGDFHAIAV